MTKNGRLAMLAAIAGAALALPAPAFATYADSVLADGPLTYLRLGEAAGATAAQDASINNRDGVYAGAPALGVAGPFIDAGTAAGLAAGDSISATVEVPSGSVELWVNPNRLANGQQAGLVAHGDPAGDGWALGIGAKRKLVWVGGGGAVSSKVTLPANSWTLLTVAWTEQKVRVYRNGALAKSLNRSGPLPLSGNGAFTIGGTGAGMFTGSFAGRIDEVALYAGELDAGDVEAHFLASHVPVNKLAPRIDGTPAVGETLTAQPGTWTDGGALTYRWQRCDADGEDCDDITGATGSTYVVGAEDACHTLQLAETASNPAGAATAISAITDQVPGTCGDPGTGGDPATGGGSDPATTTPAPAPATLGAGPAGAAAGCLKLLAGTRTRKLRGLGALRLQATPGRCLTAPLAVSFKARKGVRLKSVRYTLDGRKLKRARLKPAALRAGTHKLAVRVTPRGGRAKSATLRLRVALG